MTTAAAPFVPASSRFARAFGARIAAFALLAGAFVSAHAQSASFGFEQVATMARKLAASPYKSSAGKIPAELKNLTYDQYRDIRYRPDRSIWLRERLPFELMFFHLGGYFTEPVRINEIGAGGVREIPFDGQSFDYGKNKLTPRRWGDVGFAGFRIHYPLNKPEYKDELAVFLGASYFRALGRGERYGLSARGLAIDTVGGSGEEFPRFTEFWIERPMPAANSLVVYALLDSKRATGAYRFEFRPGEETVMDVRMRLFLRSGVSTLGIAPLTSMFLFGENQPQTGDFRPEVHDSDGLSIHTGDGEWIWRPLNNPAQTLTTSFSMKQVRGFGLMQRDRAFSSYEDLEARYELRPSAWVEPVGDWGPGRVELVQLNTPDETNDNIVAYWVPAKTPAAGQPLDLSYRLHWQGSRDARPGAWVVQTRKGRGFAALDKDEFKYVVDFDGPSLRTLPFNAPVQAVVSQPVNGSLTETNLFRNDATGGWRLTVRFKRQDPTQPVELRAFLQQGTNVLTETWSNILPPN
ncbi:MAG: glucan biosynthesis protein G [Rhodocyclaceae bacterium]